MLRSGERLEQLGGGIFVISTKEHAFGHDALLLAEFASPRKGDIVCDLGTGCGIIPLVWCRKGREFYADAVEIQEGAAQLSERSVAMSGLSDTIHVICGDYLSPSLLKASSYDLIVCNPPYRRIGSGLKSDSEALRIAHTEQCATLQQITARASKLLKNGGRFALCLPPERLAECLALMRSVGIEPKRLQLVQQNTQSRPWLFLAEGIRGARTGLVTEPVLLLDKKGPVSGE